jgi:hypothetical protein
MIAEYSDKTPHPRSPLPLAPIGERGAEATAVAAPGGGVASIEEKHKSCHYNFANINKALKSTECQEKVTRPPARGNEPFLERNLFHEANR